MPFPVFEKVGMRLVGAWTPVAGDYNNALSYMLAWESLNEREEKWQDFFNHPDWLAGREEVGKKHGAIVSREFHTFYGPTSYSPSNRCLCPSPSTRPLTTCHSEAPRGIWVGLQSPIP